MTTQLFWVGFSGLCGLPVGVETIAARGRDLDSIRVAQHVEAFGYRYRAPGSDRPPPDPG